MAIDPKLKAFLDAEPAGPPLTQLTPERVRASLAQMLSGLQFPNLPEIATTDVTIAGPGGPLPVRIFRPAGEGPLPCVVHFHGGCWSVGSLDTHTPFCRYLSAAAQAVMVLVDYRLAPEHKYPAGLEDCEAATRWVFAHAAELGIDPQRIFVSGDSAGGNLAAVVARRLRGQLELRGQLLLFPITDHYSAGYRSYEQNATGYGLTTETMQWFWKFYLEDEAQKFDPDVSPLRAEDLSGLPPALVMTGEYDVLRDEGIRYANRLREAGAAVTHVHYGQLHHNFPVWPSTVALLPQSDEARREMAAWIRSGGQR